MGLFGTKYEVKYEKDGKEYIVKKKKKNIQEAKIKFGRKYGYISKVSFNIVK